MKRETIEVVSNESPSFPRFGSLRGTRMTIRTEGNKAVDYTPKEILVRMQPKILMGTLIDVKHEVKTGKAEKTKTFNDKGWIITGLGKNIFYLSDKDFKMYFQIVEEGE